MRELYWFQNDLRLQDNPGLLAHAGARELLLVYFWPPAIPWCNLTGMGQQRERFLLESLQALREELVALGQDLLVIRGHPERELPRLVQQYRVDAVATSLAAGYFERRRRESLARNLDVPLHVHVGNTLFSEAELPFRLSDLPRHFTPFRESVRGRSCMAVCDAPATLPPPPTTVRFTRLWNPPVKPHPAMPVRGGRDAGAHRLEHWLFRLRAIETYKERRNGLDGLDGTSTLSPWLANGALSVREVAAEIARYEARFGESESSRWLFFELLWREYFQWRAIRDDIALFRAGGANNKVHRCTFEPRSFARWCQGDTNFPLVNALMRQLLATGWMSNRGRQIAASCLVNELGIDWRYGAAFFEKHLLDYDVASNYGNWQYLAGVGADPRGGRHFNLDKQTEEHDPEGLFTTKWGGYRPPQPEYVTDAADWPIAPQE
jgi:deoxyribodipyrimidine photo-lyase